MALVELNLENDDESTRLGKKNLSQLQNHPP
jgi:hypothetical protein